MPTLGLNGRVGVDATGHPQRVITQHVIAATTKQREYADRDVSPEL